MMSNPDQINETHIVVLKQRNLKDEIFVEPHKMDFEFEAECNILKQIFQDDKLDVLDMESYVNSGPLTRLLKAFNYCHFLHEPYQRLDSYVEVDRAAYMRELESKTNLHARASYIREEKLTLNLRLQKGRLAYMLNQAYDHCSQDADVFAFSHRRIGFNFPEFKLGEHMDVIFKSNFGFGNSSYFYTNIRYKGIDILPYSDWIKYSIVNKSEIIRFTRAHYPENKAWAKAMEVAQHYYNESVSDPTNFEKKWIIDECEKMVAGLVELATARSRHQVLRSEADSNTRLIFEGRDLLKFRGEKISGALSFLDRIQGLNSITDQTGRYIRTIVSLSTGIMGELKEELRKLAPELASLELQTERLDARRSSMWLEVLDYSVKQRDIVVLPSDLQNNQSIANKREEMFQALYPEYKAFHEEYEKVCEQDTELRSKYLKVKEYVDSFRSYITEIEEQALPNPQV